MTQMQKALYVQGVNKALPNIPELTSRFRLAEMVNQISAGKSPSLASKNIAEKIRKAMLIQILTVLLVLFVRC